MEYVPYGKWLNWLFSLEKSFMFCSWEVVWDVVEKTSDPQVISEPVQDSVPTKPDWGEKGYSKKFAHLVQYYLWVSTLQSDVIGRGDIEKWEGGSSSARVMGWMKMSPDFHSQFLLLSEMISRSVSHLYTRSTCKMCSSLEMKKRLNHSLLWVLGISPLSPCATPGECCRVLGSSVSLRKWQPGAAVHVLFKRNGVLGIIIS